MSTVRELPKYQSHKQVWALRIVQIDYLPNPDTSGNSAAASYGAVIHPEENFAPFEVSGEYVIKHKPKEGGYFVLYEDGYQSWSPADTFESGYTRI